MNKFYTLTNAYVEPPEKKWWKKIFKSKEEKRISQLRCLKSVIEQKEKKWKKIIKPI